MKKIIIANWKCNPLSRKQAVKLIRLFKNKAIICPPFVYLEKGMGAQNCFYQEGAFTGEVSVKMLKDIGVKYVIIGHSDRKRMFGETDEIINEKVKACLNNNIIPILCIGELKQGEVFKTLERQLKINLKNVSKTKIGKVILVYEPVWAISPQKPCSVDNALTAILFMRKIVSKMFNPKIARTIKVVYGGSVNSKNAGKYLKEKEINGVLVGAASLIPKEFLSIINTVKN